MRSVEYPHVGEIAEASYPVKVFAGVLVELMEGDLCVQFVCVRLRDKKRDKLEIKEDM